MIEGGSDLPESPGAERGWIAVDLALRPGYSGGQLVNPQGKLIGMSTLMAGLEVGMAVPSHAIEESVAKAISADARESDTALGYWLVLRAQKERPANSLTSLRSYEPL